MNTVCSIDWAAIYPSAPKFVDATRRQSDVSLTKIGGDTLLDLHARDSVNEDFAPTLSTFTSRAQSQDLQPKARAAIIRDLNACAVKQPKAVGVQLRSAARQLAAR